jgi:hypothetical protein
VWWAEREFELSAPLPDGGTLRDEFRLYREQVGRRHADDRPSIKPPQELFDLWGWFQEIASGRPIAGAGALLPVPPSEIMAWATLRRVVLADWEVDAIGLLDGAYIRTMNASRR